MSSAEFSRRRFLKWAGAAAAGAALSQPLSALARPYFPPGEEEPKPPYVEYVPARVLAASVAVYDSLDPGKRRVLRTVRRDQMIDVAGEYEGPGPQRNRTWYGTRDGYVYSAWLQKMQPFSTPKMYTDLGQWGIWIESIVANAPAYAEPDDRSRTDYIVHYGTVYHATAAYVAADGRIWYNTYDEYASKVDNIAPTNHWVPAVFFRKIETDEFKPINPGVEDKHIHVDLGKQEVTCYEGDTVVLTSRCASGASFKIKDQVVDYSTPRGDFKAILKMPSRHMRAPDAERDTDAWFDLPGVPWNTFFTYDGIALHGTYWHNDFGVPRSHGCVNLPIEVARWIYFWTEPPAPYEDDFVQGDIPQVTATPIMVV